MQESLAKRRFPNKGTLTLTTTYRYKKGRDFKASNKNDAS
jgi:hypothetical protein